MHLLRITFLSFLFAILSTLMVAQTTTLTTDLQPRHAQAQAVTSKCTLETYFVLDGEVRIGDQIMIHVRWPVACGADCQILGSFGDELGNLYYPVRNWGDAHDMLGLKCGADYCEYRLQTDDAGSKAAGIDTIHIPLFCPASSVYGIYVEAQNGKF